MRLKNVTLIILNYNIFQLVTCWLDSFLSPFLDTVDDSFGDFLTNYCYLLVVRFFQFGDSLGIIHLHSFLSVTQWKKIEVWNIWRPNRPLNIPTEIRFSLKFIVQRWHARNKIPYLNMQWADFENHGCLRNQREEIFPIDAGRHDTA